MSPPRLSEAAALRALAGAAEAVTLHAERVARSIDLLGMPDHQREAARRDLLEADADLSIAREVWIKVRTREGHGAR